MPIAASAPPWPPPPTPPEPPLPPDPLAPPARVPAEPPLPAAPPDPADPPLPPFPPAPPLPVLPPLLKVAPPLLLPPEPPEEIGASGLPEPPFDETPPEPDEPPLLPAPPEPPEAEEDPPDPVVPPALVPPLPPDPPLLVPPPPLCGPAQPGPRGAAAKEPARQMAMHELRIFIVVAPFVIRIQSSQPALGDKCAAPIPRCGTLRVYIAQARSLQRIVASHETSRMAANRPPRGCVRAHRLARPAVVHFARNEAELLSSYFMSSLPGGFDDAFARLRRADPWQRR